MLRSRYAESLSLLPAGAFCSQCLDKGLFTARVTETLDSKDTTWTP
jgi:hypothetical protein